MKLGFFILPNKDLKKDIIHSKKILLKKYKKHKYLNHFPHCTLYIIEIKNKDYKKFLMSIDKFINIKVNLVLKKIKFFKDDPITNQITYFYDIEKNKNLKYIQKLLIKKYYMFAKKTISKDIKLKWMQKNQINYGYYFVNNKFKPHMTIGSIDKKYKNDQEIKRILNKKINFHQKISQLYLFKINDDRHIHLKSIKLND